MDNFDKNFKKVTAAIVVVWVLMAAVSLTVVGVIIWAIIKLVTHFLG